MVWEGREVVSQITHIFTFFMHIHCGAPPLVYLLWTLMVFGKIIDGKVIDGKMIDDKIIYGKLLMVKLFMVNCWW